ncbi:hypothetical protein ACHWQZ_G007304 [Mnemiopsis leidyi]
MKSPETPNPVDPPERPFKVAAKKKITQYFRKTNDRTNIFPPQESAKATEEPHCKLQGTNKESASRASSGKSRSYVTTVKQINLQKKKSANYTYFQELKFNEILLGQEPYFHKNKLMSVPTTHKPFTPYHKDTPRVCIILPLELGNISYSMTNFSNRDMITVRCNLKNRKDVVLCSIYMGHEPNNPEIDHDTVIKMANLVNFTKNKDLPLVMGADSNGHHMLWNSFKANDKRGILLAQLIEKWELTVANQGKSPTFVNSRGHKSIIDITMTNRKGNPLISNWKVDKNPSLSDHKMITFDLDLGNKWESYKRNYQDMDSKAFQIAVAKKLETRPFRAKIGEHKKNNIDSSVKFINKIMIEALDEVCPMVKITHRTKIPWSKELDSLKRKNKKAKSNKIRASSKLKPLPQKEFAAISQELTAAEGD